MRSRHGHTPIHTLVSGKKGLLGQWVIVSLTYAIRPKSDTHMFGNAAIAAGQTYHIKTKLALVADTDVVAIVVPRRYS